MRCDCGGVLDLPLRAPAPRPGPPAGPFPAPTTWVSPEALAASALGVRPTPMLRWHEQEEVWLKCDHLLPTGSFKDRGAHLLAALGLQLGVEDLVIDSSGNAAAALAAHAARAGLRCTVFVPADASPNKLRQIATYGAELRTVPGPREAATAAARDFVARTGALYASHALNPYFYEGTKGWLYEVLAERPDVRTLVVPVGSGSLLLGILRGLQELIGAGWIDRTPELILAQAAGYATLAAGRPAPLTTRRSGPPTGDEPAPLAEGIAISHPLRLEHMRSLLAGYRSRVCVLAPAEITNAHRELASGGFYVEPTSAAAWAAWRGTPHSHGPAVVALTGHGLKTT
jgi:threonine synthase